MGDQQANLIINYLPQSLSDQEFQTMFEGIGPTKSCRIIRDKASNYSFGYGFVDYENPEDAIKAIDTLNGLQLLNKRIKVAFSRKHDKMDKTQLYVTNIPKHYTQEQVQALCESYGIVINARLLTEPNTGESKGIGFILFDNNDQAASALAGLEGMMLDGAEEALSVRYVDDFYNKHKQKNFRPPKGFQSNMGGGDDSGFYGGDGGFGGMGGGNGYGGGFEGYGGGYGGGQMGGRGGAMRNRGGGMGGRGGGMGNQRFNPMGRGGGRGRGAGRGGGGMGGRGGGASNNAIPQLVSYPIHALGSNYNPTPRNTNAGGDGSGVVLYVYNIGPDTDEDGLWQLFAPFGTVVKVDVIRDFSKNKGKGYGFVTMGSYEQAEQAISGRNGFLFNSKPLQVRYHTPGKGK